ncbi:MAG: TonB-dependent receptor [Massilia sp.]
MKIFNGKHARNGALVFKLSPVAAGCAVFLSALGTNVYAQDATVSQSAQVTDANGNPVSQVTVTGIRRGIEAAISIKKNSNSIVEAISAEDIGKLPDATVAESISRLPGVTAQRDPSTGRAAAISVRGMSPDFNGTLLNGREQASAGDSRGVRFDLYPAEMLGTITVYKSPDATLMGQGVASTIDQRTVLPLDFGKRTVAVGYKRIWTGEKNEAEGGGTGKGYRSTITYIDQFANRTVGVALGLVKFSDSGADQTRGDGWGGWTPALKDVGVPAYNGSDTIKVPGGFQSVKQRDPQGNKSAMAVVQFRPSKEFVTTVDLFHSKFTDDTRKNGLEGAVCGNNGSYDPSGVLSNAQIVNGVAVSGTCSNYKAVQRNDIVGQADTLNSWGLNSRLKSGEWTFTGDLSGSKVTHHTDRYETTAGRPGNATDLDTISWTGFNGTSNLSPTYKVNANLTDRSRYVLTDVNGWGGSVPQAGYVAVGDQTDDLKAIRLSAKRDVEWGPVTALDFGVYHSNRDKERVSDEGNLTINNLQYGSTTVPGTETGVTPNGIPIVRFNPAGTLGTVYTLLPKKDQPIQTDKNWEVSERITTLYAMGNLEGQLFGFPYRGNVGAQYVRTNQSSSGVVVQPGNPSGCGDAGKPCASYAIGGGAKYNDFLPSLNLGFELPYDQMLRFGLGKTLSRTKMSDMRPGGGVSVSTNGSNGERLSGGAGNPKLEPFRAKALDLSYEKYFTVNGAKGYVALAGFYKKLDTYVLQLGTEVDFKTTGYYQPGMRLPTSGPYAGSTVGILTVPTNLNGGNIKGMEATVSLPFAMVSKYLSGFGLEVNYSSTLSSLSLPSSGLGNTKDTPSNVTLPGLSHIVTNARLYYEANGFRASLAAKKRGDFLGEVTDFQDNHQLTYIKASTLIDAQVTYDFDDKSMFKGLSITASANNLTNAAFDRFNTTPDVAVEHYRFGRTYGLGASYKF